MVDRLGEVVRKFPEALGEQYLGTLDPCVLGEGTKSALGWLVLTDRRIYLGETRRRGFGPTKRLEMIPLATIYAIKSIKQEKLKRPDVQLGAVIVFDEASLSIAGEFAEGHRDPIIVITEMSKEHARVGLEIETAIEASKAWHKPGRRRRLEELRLVGKLPQPFGGSR